MGANNQVTLTFAGDTTKVSKSFSDVGSAAENVKGKVHEASKSFDEMENGFSKTGEKADVAEKNIIGAKDIIDGTATIMQGPGKQGIASYLQGWADLAGGIAPVFENLGKTKIAMIAHVAWSGIVKVATLAWAGVQWILNAALDANPIGLLVIGIGLLIAAVVLIATKTDWFQKIWKVAWSGIKDAASAVWDFLKKIPGWIGDAFSKIAGAISGPFKSAFNFVSDIWNNTIGKLKWTVPDWIPVIGGKTIQVPQLPHFHSGGVVPGVPGESVLAVLQAGERVTSVAGAPNNSSTQVTFGGRTDSAFAQAFMNLYRIGEIQIG